MRFIFRVKVEKLVERAAGPLDGSFVEAGSCEHAVEMDDCADAVSLFGRIVALVGQGA